jgi:hypothetical protein
MQEMSWMTIIWSMLASASIVIGMMHLFLWRRNISRDDDLVSSLMAVTAGGVALTELALAKVYTLSAVPIILRLGNLFVGITVVAMTWFLHRYLGTGRRSLLLAITGLWSCGLIVNFLSPWSLTFSEVTGLRELTTFWGEPYHLILGSGNPFKILADLASLLVAVFVVDASIQAWRSGRKRQAGITGGKWLGMSRIQLVKRVKSPPASSAGIPFWPTSSLRSWTWVRTEPSGTPIHISLTVPATSRAISRTGTLPTSSHPIPAGLFSSDCSRA